MRKGGLSDADFMTFLVGLILIIVLISIAYHVLGPGVLGEMDQIFAPLVKTFENLPVSPIDIG